jgi:hypothetical protein
MASRPAASNNRPTVNSVLGLLLVFVAFIAAGCGGASGDDSGKPPTVTAQSAASGTASYRSAVNALFDAVIAARGSYQAAHGETALRASAVAIAKADDAALARLKAIRVPGSAQTLHAQLVQSLRTQEAELKTVLKGSKLNTAKLGDAVLMSNDTERLVNQINALP